MPQTSKSSIKSNTNEKPAKKKAETVSVAERVARMGLINDWDFVLHRPLRYEDETRITRICDLKAGYWAQIQGTVISSRTQGGRFMQLIASVSDGTANIEIRFLHFYPKMRERFKSGTLLRLSGQVQQQPVQFGGGLQMLHPKVKDPITDTSERKTNPRMAPSEVRRASGSTAHTSLRARGQKRTASASSLGHPRQSAREAHRKSSLFSNRSAKARPCGDLQRPCAKRSYEPFGSG